jgi:hypothetical protein
LINKTLSVLCVLFLAVSGLAQAQVAWTYIAQGQFELNNPTKTQTSVTIDAYFGDGDVCGTNLACYYHSTPSVGLAVQPGGSRTFTYTIWENIFSGSNDTDYQAFWVYASSTKRLTCLTGTNEYITTEHNQGPAATSGDGSGPFWMTHQGGASGKDCDTATVTAGVATQIASDNAGSNNPNAQQAGGTAGVSGAAAMRGQAMPALDFSPCQNGGPHPVAWSSSDPLTRKSVDACPAAFR